MAYALKFAYDGTAFHGYQRQPISPTVEGEMLRAMQHTKMINDPRTAFFRSASRTDRGVSALGNVVCFSTEFRKENILRALSSCLDNIWVYGIAEVPEKFNPRHASQRWYRYLLKNDGHDINAMRNCCELFIGTHNFKNFSRGDGNPVRKIDEISIEDRGYFIVLDFKAPNFLWNMVRRLVSALERISRGELELSSVKRALQGIKRIDVGLSPPENLLLVDIFYEPNIEFETIGQGLEAVRQALYKNIEMRKINLYLMENVAERLNQPSTR